VENISLPQEVEAALDKRIQHGHRRQSRSVHPVSGGGSLRDAAANPGVGSEALNMGLGLGDGATAERYLGAPDATGSSICTGDSAAIA
jgi:hypothetical protein